MISATNLENIGLFVWQYAKQSGYMHVLKHRLVVVRESQWVPRLH